MLKVELKGTGHKRLKKAMAALQGDPAQKAHAMALNEVGRVARNKVERAVGKQMGVGAKIAGKRGNISTSAAMLGRLQYVIKAEGGFMSLKDYGAKQGAKGTRSKPWGTSRLFGGTFMGPRPGAVAMSLGGHVFKRVGEKRVMKKGAFKGQTREPIERLHGPALPKEIVKGASKEVFETYTAQRLPKRVAHHLKRATNGAFD